MLILTDLKHLTVELREGRDKLQEEEVKVVRTMETEQEILLSSGQLQLTTMQVSISHLKYTGAY